MTTQTDTPAVSDEQRRALVIALKLATRDRDYVREELASTATKLAERLQRVATNVALGSTVNRLGEVQGFALDVDRLCALLAAHEAELERVTAIAAAFGIDASTLY